MGCGKTQAQVPRNSTWFLICSAEVGGTQAHNPTQLLADREALLGCEQYSGMFAPDGDPLGVEAIEITHIEGVEDTFVRGGKGQVLFSRSADQPGVQRGQHGDATRAQGGDQIPIHRIFVNVYAEAAHGRGLLEMLCLEDGGGLRFGFEVGIDLRLIGMVAGQCGIDLRE